MKLALAQINMRLGDIQGLCARVEEQAVVARHQGADLLAVPAPLTCGIAPGTLIESANFQHDLLSGLTGLAASLVEQGPVCLVPAIIPVGDGSLFEVFMLRDGHVSPLRLAFMRYKEGTPFDPWTPPIFDVDDLRIAVTFDLARDIADIPAGCDLVLSFQVSGFNVIDPMTQGASSLDRTPAAELARDNHLWIAQMMPVGGFDEAVYPGGSFILDEEGHLSAFAPNFEEHLLVEEIQRGIPREADATRSPAIYNREEWIWQTLRIHLRDTVLSQGASRVCVHLTGDLPSALAAALAVDALGPRNVLAVHMGCEDARTPAEAAAESERAARVRELASSLHVRLIERTVEGAGLTGDPDTPTPASRARLLAGIEALRLDDTASELGAVALSALTKTHYALAGGLGAFAGHGTLAPFGDIYLTELEFLARWRNRVSPVLPTDLTDLRAVRRSMAELVATAVRGFYRDAGYAERVGALLGGLEPSEVDGALEGHVDRNLPLEEIPRADEDTAPIAMLLLLVRRGEAHRRRLPPYPIVSARAFAERAWPAQLAWADLGRHGADPMDAEGLARASIERYRAFSEGEAERMRREVMGLIGGMMGLTTEQVEGLASSGSPEQIERELERLQGRFRDAVDGRQGASRQDGQAGGPQADIMGTAGTYPFFSRN
ncbi:MAG: hypothetical protein SOY67_04120 [Collinsella sp.]|nr:hypothetical protein [Collinsella sp.]